MERQDKYVIIADGYAYAYVPSRAVAKDKIAQAEANAKAAGIKASQNWEILDTDEYRKTLPNPMPDGIYDG